MNFIWLRNVTFMIGYGGVKGRVVTLVSPQLTYPLVDLGTNLTYISIWILLNLDDYKLGLANISMFNDVKGQAFLELDDH